MARLQHVERLDQRVVDRHEVAPATGTGLGDPEHLLLGVGQDLGAVAALGLEAVGDYPGAHFDDLRGAGLVVHDTGVSVAAGVFVRRSGLPAQYGAPRYW